MCGIVGYIGKKNAQEVILSGLEKLEYRGYDSSGISVNTSEGMKTVKFKGRLSVLDDYLTKNHLSGTVGIGHTRWATHGAPSDVNAHPHVNMMGNLAVVHNGIIENYIQIKEKLSKDGYEFISETDTEVVAHLIDYYYHGDLLDAVYNAIGDMRGAYALGVIASDNPNEMVAVRKESPLVIGLGKGEYFIASDIPAILNYTRNVYFLENGEVVHLTKKGVTVYDKNRNKVDKTVFKVEWDVEAASKGGYDHFMLKEIHEQPNGIKETLIRRLDDNGMINLDSINIPIEVLTKINKIYIVACGTAYHAGCIGKYAIEKLAKIPVETDIASEFRYSDPFVDEKTLLILVSQSGETADTLAALREAKRKGARVLAITNVVGSSIAREADDVFYTWAGPEIAVASTKAYTTQMVAFYMIALDIAIKKGTINKEEYLKILAELHTLPAKVDKVLDCIGTTKIVAQDLKYKPALFYIGRGVDYQTAREGALKLKEISYIYTEAFAAGELKHGTIALIEEGTPVIAIITQKNLYEKMISNIREVKARGAYVIAIAIEGAIDIEKVADKVIYIPKSLDLLMPVISILPCQLIAYYASIYRGNDVDKPRNLAKSVTVE
ncbi:MAG: glutamine--fructose-6-phosphate transaminase (isomerizing) [Clostridia bacterium]